MGFGVASAPAGNLGYNRVSDWPSTGGVGATKTNNGGSAMGLNATINPGSTQWHPTVKWMLGFVVAELVAYHVLCRVLNI